MSHLHLLIEKFLLYKFLLVAPFGTHEPLRLVVCLVGRRTILQLTIFHFVLTLWTRLLINYNYPF